MAKKKDNTKLIIGVLIGALILGFFIFSMGGRDIELSQYRTRILSWDSPTTYSSWEIMSNLNANYISIGDRFGSYITIAEISNCKKRIDDMTASNDIKYKEEKCGIKIYEGYQPHLEHSTATKESEWLCSADNKFIVSIRPKDSPIKDKYFEEFSCSS